MIMMIMIDNDETPSPVVKVDQVVDNDAFDKNVNQINDDACEVMMMTMILMMMKCNTCVSVHHLQSPKLPGPFELSESPIHWS